MANINEGCPSPTTGVAAQTFASAIKAFTAAQCVLNNQDWPPDANVPNGQTFDFIIVGAGSAGCVVANRLSEVTQWNVLLIEAGDDPPVESIIPNLHSAVLKTQYDWQYYTTNDGRTNQANKNGSVYWPRGKMLGGCSSINGMIYVRGNDHDFQQWAEEGNPEWAPEIVTKYFKKAESLQDQTLLKRSNIRRDYGLNGPQVINRFNRSQELTDIELAVVNSLARIGFKPIVDDINTANSLGAGILSATAANGERQSTAKTYLNPIRNRSNLKVIKNTLVTKILINNSSGEACGVEVERNGEIMFFYASKEVILSAGSINTPQLLMESGIGPEEHLLTKNIPSVADLPAVGKNLQDHMIIPVPIYGNKPGVEDEMAKQFDTIRYLYNRKGILSTSHLTDVTAFYTANKKAKFPSYQTHLIIIYQNSSFTRQYTESANYLPPVVESFVEQNRDKALYLFLFNLLHPLSKGNISLNSADPKDHPIIYPNYFTNPKDLDAAVLGIKMLTKIVNTPYFQSIKGGLGRISWPACDGYALDSNKYWQCVCINMVITVFHPVGTAKMGPNPETSVVNSRLKVHKVNKLRIIDASVMPTLTSGNTNAPTIMIGERGSDLVKEDFGVIS